MFQYGDPHNIYTEKRNSGRFSIAFAREIYGIFINLQVLWTAPDPGHGCILFKATVIEHRDVWYMDGGPLTKEFCENEYVFDDVLTTPNNKCCACAEAKYEV